MDQANKAMGQREDAADGKLGNKKFVNMFGNGAVSSQIYDLNMFDNINAITFGEIEEPWAIAVTIVWWIFTGPTRNRVLVEWDQIYDIVDFDRSIIAQKGKMNFPNILTHELGHALGLEDLYSSSCNEETMYGYASLGENKKASLNIGDIEGVNRLY